MKAYAIKQVLYKTNYEVDTKELKELGKMAVKSGNFSIVNTNGEIRKTFTLKSHHTKDVQSYGKDLFKVLSFGYAVIFNY